MKKQLVGLLIGLGLEYIFGMATMAYVKFPEDVSEGELFHFASTHFISGVHIFLAYALVLGSLVFVIRTFLAHQTALKLPASLGFLAILIAGYGGETFIRTDNETYSFIMALGFLIAFVAYGWGLFTAKRTG